MAEEEPEAEPPNEDARVCRICLSSEAEVEGQLVAPCKCRGSMKYVHSACLRTWRRQSFLSRGADVCNVCGEAYLVDGKFLLTRLWLKHPAIVTSAAVSLLGGVLVPRTWWQIAGATCAHLFAPLTSFDVWLPWEARRGLWPNLACVAAGGTVVLTLPALADHFVAFLWPRSTLARICELALFFENALRIEAILRAASVYRLLCTPTGFMQLNSAHKLVAGMLQGERLKMLKGRGFLDERSVVSQMIATCNDPVTYFYLEVLSARIGIRSKLRRWLPLFWSVTNSDIGHSAILADLVFSGPVLRGCAALVHMAFPSFDNSDLQVQHMCYNLRDFACSVIRGIRALRGAALYCM